MKESPAVLWFLAALAAIACLIAFADRPVNAWIGGMDGGLIEAYRAITQIGNSRWYLFSLPVVMAVALWLRERSGGENALVCSGVAGMAAFLWAAIAVSGITTNLLKVSIGRARPKLWDQEAIYGLSPLTFDYDRQSFPSGHATTMFALATALGLLIPRFRIPLYALAAVFSLTRVAVNAHFPSDIVAGAVVGTVVPLLLARALAGRGLMFRKDAAGKIRLGPAATAALQRLGRSFGQTRKGAI